MRSTSTFSQIPPTMSPTENNTPFPQPPKRAATFASSSQHTDLAPSTTSFRGPRRKSSGQSLSSSHSRSPDQRSQPSDRRASTFSLSSIDELSQSLTEDLINPSFTRERKGESEDDEVTNWHSTPLLFALLPAVGGVLFKEGAAVVTDLLILGLAAIFLNWSVRLPWDWYYAAQVLVREARGRVREVDRGEDEDEDKDAISEEDEHRVAEGEDARIDAPERNSSPDNRTETLDERRAAALSGLYTQETLALFSTFLFPAIAAYLLHILRSQLSKPSTGLVSDYNLSVFLLVAEIRPCRQLIRLIKRRTLHLQRTVAGSEDPLDQSSGSNKAAVSDLTSRIQDLEDRLDNQSSPDMNGHTAKTSQLDELSLEMKKRYESRIDALERALRRYEKRTTTLAMVTEQRLKAIDITLSDTLSLAAAAAQQSNQRSATGRMLDTVLALLMLPVQVAGLVVMWPVWVLEDVYRRVSVFMFGKPKAKGSGKRIVSGEARGEKARDRVPGRKSEAPR